MQTQSGRMKPEHIDLTRAGFLDSRLRCRTANRVVGCNCVLDPVAAAKLSSPAIDADLIPLSSFVHTTRPSNMPGLDRR